MGLSSVSRAEIVKVPRWSGSTLGAMKRTGEAVGKVYLINALPPPMTSKPKNIALS